MQRVGAVVFAVARKNYSDEVAHRVADPPSEPCHQSELPSELLRDLFELEECSAVSWPARFDARIARLILRERHG